MANVLFVESDPIAVKAFTGIVERSAHVMKQVDTVSKAWKALQEGPYYDLVVVELKLEGNNGKSLISQLREHPFYNRQHVLVYSRVADRETVRQVLLMDVQNYLIKPYDDLTLYTEINRAAHSPWWAGYFEPKDIICNRLGCEPYELEAHYRGILETLRSFPAETGGWFEEHMLILRQVVSLLENAGFNALREILSELIDAVSRERAHQVSRMLGYLPGACRLLEEHLEPGLHRPRKLHEEEKHREQAGEGLKRQFQQTQAVADWEKVTQKINEMEGFPVVETVAASFQMAARNPEIEIETLVDMIETDPCLSAHLLYYANCVSKLATFNDGRVEDPKQAIQMLGLARIRAVAMSLISIPDADFKSHAFNWKKYWMFQMGCAMFSEEIVKMLSLSVPANLAYFGGLFHELGKLILFHCYPETYASAMRYASATSISLTETERHFFGCTHFQTGAFFAKKSRLSGALVACIEHYEEPSAAPAHDQELVAAVSLADFLCKYFEVGYSGSRLPRGVHSFAGHPAWGVIKPLMYHGFTVARFERVCHEHMRTIKRTLIGLSEQYHG